jgi:DNA-binding SARP family transcriptional activator
LAHLPGVGSVGHAPIPLHGVDLHLLGPVEALLDGRSVALGAPKQRAVLAMLALRVGHTVSADRLAEGLWGEHPPPSAPKMVQLYVSHLRRLLDGNGAEIVTHGRGYELRLVDGDVDALHFERLLDEARPREALALWRGEALADLVDEPFAAAEVRRLDALRLHASELAIDEDIEAGRHGEVIGELDALIDEHPLREQLHARRMLALYRCGRQAEALEAYRDARAVLVEQVGVEPGGELRRLQEAILAQDPALDGASGLWPTQSTPPPARPPPNRRRTVPPPSLPAQLQPRPAMPFVGRAAALGRLAALLDRARTDGRQIAVVGGEPGSGKTRLAREFAEHATSVGVSVLYGACDPAVRTPYQPLVEALEPALAGLEADEPEPGADHYPASLTRLLPGLRAKAGDPTAATGDAEAKDPDAERHELHTALTALLARLTANSPAMLVLDDAQWADASSLLLLRHLARTLGAARIVVVVLFRDGGAELPEALASTLAELHRLDGVERIRLDGLVVAEVQELVHRSSDSVWDVDGELAEQLVGLTDGNAFLVGEVWRHMLAREGGPEGSSPAGAAIPESVREVMADRVSSLTPVLGELLQLIAVSPRGIALPVLRAAALMGDEPLLSALEEGLHTGMLDEIRDANLVYRIRHELLRRTVYERVSSIRAAALHLRVGEALEAMPGGRRDRIINELAFHFRAAAPVAGNSRAVGYALEAAAQAERSLAFDEAAGRFEEALALGVPDLPAEADVRCRQGLAWHLAGRSADALESFAAAAAAARECGDEALQARAAIGFETACWRPGIDDPRAVALLHEAARGVAAEPSALRVRVLAHLSRALAYRGDHAKAGECWSQAVAMARLVADPGALMVALSHAAWTRGSRALDEILADLAEAVELARMLPHDPLSDVARGMRIALLIEAYAIDEARADIAAHRELSERAGQHFLAVIVEQHDAILALCDGQLDAAEAAANRADEIARRLEGASSAVYGIQMFSIRREQGRLGEIAPLVRLIASGDMKADSLWRPALAVLLAEIGDIEAARRELRKLIDTGLEAIPRGGLGVGGMTYLADACALIEDAALAPPIYEQLLAYEGQNTVIGSAVACYGAADRMLGALATVMRHWDDAERHLENALALNRRMGSPTWIAHTQYERARLTVRRGRPYERELARERASEALDAAQRTGLHGLVARVERLTASLPATTAGGT